MNKFWYIAIAASVAVLAVAFALSPARAEDWYLIAPISAEGHSHPFVVYNTEPYADEDACSEVLGGEEFVEVFNDWQESELAAHKGDVTFGKPTCVPDPASVKADKS